MYLVGTSNTSEISLHITSEDLALECQDPDVLTLLVTHLVVDSVSNTQVFDMLSDMFKFSRIISPCLPQKVVKGNQTGTQSLY